MSSSSRSRGKKPQDPDDSDQSNGADSSSTDGSVEVNPGLGFQLNSPVPGPSEEEPSLSLRRSFGVTAVASSHAQSALLAMEGNDSGYESPPDDVPIGQLFRENRLRPVRSTAGEGGKSGGEIGRKRKWGPPGKGVRIEENNGDESVGRRRIPNEVIEVEDEEHQAEENENPGGDEGGASRREKVSNKGKGKEKVVQIVDYDPEPDTVENYSNPDLGVSEELMEKMRGAVKDFTSSLPEQVQVEPQPQEVPQDMVDRPLTPRREQWRSRAKQLAPDYARFSKEKGEEAVKNDLPIPDRPGPFSKAMEIIKDQRAAMFGDGKAGSSEGNNSDYVRIPWTPSNEFHRGLLGLKMLTCREMALMHLAEHAEEITSLVGIPQAMRNQLSFVLCHTRKMNMNLLTMLMEGNLTDLKLSDCSWASEKNFEDAFGNCNKSNLEVLELDRCGRCMPDSVVHSTLALGLNSLPSLKKLSLKGHYSLSDKGLATIVSSAPLLNSLNLSQCSLLTTEGMTNLVDKQALVLKEFYIDECQNVNAMSILPSLKKVKTLEILSMAGIPSVSNEFVHELISVCGTTIRELNFADCDKLTSSAIKVIGENCPNLSALDIRNLTELKDSAIAHLANGCRGIQKLQLHKSSFSDEVIAAFVRASGENLIELSLNKVSKVGNLTALAIADVCRCHLKKLDLSFCHHMDDNALGTIVDSCSSLKILKLFGCSQVTDLFLKGYFNRSVRILGVNGISMDYLEIPYF